jgi:hypothetical protein
MSIVGRNCDEHLGSPSLDLSLPICEKKERKVFSKIHLSQNIKKIPGYEMKHSGGSLGRQE